MTKRLGGLTLVLIGAVCGMWLGGCASAGPAELSIAPGGYAAAFDAAREVLRDARFEVDRVDARAGVISAAPKPSMGLAAPWDLAQISPGHGLGDALNRHARRIRITFEPAAAAAGGAGQGEGAAEQDLAMDAVPDLLEAEPSELVMRVRVIVEREQRPGWRLESTSVQLSTRVSDPELVGRGMEPAYFVALREDPHLGGKLAQRIAQRLRGDAGER